MPTTLFGRRMDQEWVDLMIWEEFFKAFPVKTFIELGTGMGGMSTYFALQCYERGIKFHTFDNQKWINFSEPIPALLNMERSFCHVDLWEYEGRHVSRALENAAHPLMLFCDNGDKPREWRMFAPYTLPGDYIAVHDWGTEFFEKDIGNIPVERILTELCDARRDGYKAMWFRRV